MIMNGQMRRYNLRNKEYLDLPEPIPMPDVKMDIRGIIQYAKDKGMSVPELSEEEKNMFVQ